MNEYGTLANQLREIADKLKAAAWPGSERLLAAALVLDAVPCGHAVEPEANPSGGIAYCRHCGIEMRVQWVSAVE